MNPLHPLSPLQHQPLHLHMQTALTIAAQAQYLTSPNPAIGCVLVGAKGTVLGQGHTQTVGGAHAEIMALRDAAANGHLQNGKLPTSTTAYVTLEPCNHQGRTGPCSLALIHSGIAKVVAANLDPNPLVAGQGVEALRQAGVEVEVLDPQSELAIAARESYIGFFKRMSLRSSEAPHGLPWVRAKAAASLDGITALPNGASQWITGDTARTDGHAWRARACAVLTGIGTVLADDPQLDVRHVATARQPTLVLVDSKLDVPLHAKIFDTHRSVWIYTAAAAPTNHSSQEKEAALQARGAQIIRLPDSNSHGKVDLAAMMADLGRRQINELHVEAGFKLNGSLANAGLIDEWLIYLAPLLLGAGAGIAHLHNINSLQAARRLAFQSITPLGQDLRVLARYLD
jgi:diaminohydroxyphosphoribosylaminopyrimidine deaminase / 5-amino-6-(5-phosphoribosylamino)uracil reductase